MTDGGDEADGIGIAIVSAGIIRSNVALTKANQHAGVLTCEEYVQTVMDSLTIHRPCCQDDMRFNAPTLPGPVIEGHCRYSLARKVLTSLAAAFACLCENRGSAELMKCHDSSP